MDIITFSRPIFLWFLLFMPLLAAVHFYSLRFARQKAMRFANFEALEKIVQSRQIIPNNYLLLAMRIFTLALFTLAAAGVTAHYFVTAPAYDFVVALDASSSMQADDLQPTRMDAATSAVSAWMNSLPGGPAVGLVTFSSQATVALTPTQDHARAAAAVKAVVPERSGGTAICEALRASSNLLMNSDYPRAIVLLSDGQNNAGCLLPEGIEYARQGNCTVFAIGVGSRNGGSIDGLRDVVFRLDEADLQRAATETGGAYYRAETPSQISDALAVLNSPVQRQESLELDTYAMLFAFLLVFAEWGLSITRYRVIP